jgi:hypothetical protein
MRQEKFLQLKLELINLSNTTLLQHHRHACQESKQKKTALKLLASIYCVLDPLLAPMEGTQQKRLNTQGGSCTNRQESLAPLILRAIIFLAPILLCNSQQDRFKAKSTLQE